MDWVNEFGITLSSDHWKAQPRVPAGMPEGGEWTTLPGKGGVHHIQVAKAGHIVGGAVPQDWIGKHPPEVADEAKEIKPASIPEPQQTNSTPPPPDSYPLRIAKRTAAKEGVTIPNDLADGAARWSASLSDEQRNAVQVYGSGAYSDINAALRGGGDLGDLGPIYQELSSAIKASPKFAPINVHRGMRLQDPNKAKEFLDNMQKAASSGGSIKLGGITSMTLNPKITDHFINEEYGKEGTAVLMQIKAHSGAFISAEVGPEAMELAHDHNQEYHVRGMTKRKDGTVVIDLEQK